ncbi:MAG: TrkA C-terminal domain-containing protein [Spirochaetales bacterium]|nr:TrkA C-terminal domain-containing protein [Spirochaetales bacterium]
MGSIISFFVVLLLSFIIVRAGTTMLYLTGMSYDVAKFQARSAFTGTGFTSQESEMILAHPVRRKIILSLMLIGNIGFVSFVSSLIISFSSPTNKLGTFLNFLYIIIGLVLLLLLSKSKLVEKGLGKIIEKFLIKFTQIHVQDYESLLNISGKFDIIKVPVVDDSWLGDKKLQELSLSAEGMLVLGIEKSDGYYIGAPKGSSLITFGDQIVLYGREKSIKNLVDRKAGEEGDAAHLAAVDYYKKNYKE